MNVQILAAKIRAIRERQQLSLSEFAAITGIALRQVCKLENAQVPNPQAKTIGRLKAAYPDDF